MLTRIKSTKEANAFLQDLLTPSELESITQRVQLVKLLIRGVPQREISEELGVSIDKVTRGSKALKKSKGGFWRLTK